MTAIRAWVFLLTVLCAVAAALVIVLPQTLVDDLDRETTQHLERGRRTAAMMLHLNARKWIDTAGKLANDAVLIESLDEATRGPADLQIVHRTVQDRLRAFNEQMKVELVLATDAHGRVIARAGVDATAYKDVIDGYPLVGDALRGLRGDDTWSLGGKLYRVAASPVILRDHYVGSVLLGQEVGAELAESIEKALAADVVFLLKGRIIASTAPLPILDRLAASADDAGEAPITIDQYSVAVSSFPGEAAAQHAQYVLVAPRRAGPVSRQLLALLPHDLRALPTRTLAPIAGAALVLLIIGFAIVSAFGSRPNERLARDAQALSRGELSRMPENAHRGAQRTVAQAVNTLIERVAGRIRAESRVSEPEPPLRPHAHAATLTSPVPIPQMPSAPVVAMPIADDSLPAVPTNVVAPARAPMLGERSEVGEFDDAKTAAIPGPKILPSLGSITPLPPNAPAVDSNSSVLAVPRTDRPTTPNIPRGRGFDEMTSVESPSEAMLLASAHDTSEEVEADFQRVYNEFIATRETCGETLEGVTFDKFVLKLRQNRSQLIERYGCTSVKFQVYIRDGKTALKATPVT